MQIIELVLENVGPYRGREKFRLRPESEEKPIVLVGGRNGAGKTTIFQAILIALYGQGWNERQTKKEYRENLQRLIHSGPDEISPDQACIELEFTYGHLGEEQRYRVIRSWSGKDRDLEEDLEVFRDGEKLSEVERNHWREFLRELVPPGISDLFFFDGERIKALAGEERLNQVALREALDALLGLDVVEQLSEDLRVLVSRESRQLARGEISEKIERLEEELESLLSERQEIQSELKERQQKRVELKEELARVEQEISEEGGRYAQQRDELREQRSRLEAEIEFVEERLREHSRELLPVTLCPEYAELLRDRLRKENELEQWRAAESVLEDVRRSVQERVGNVLQSIPTDLSKETRHAILATVTEGFERDRPPELETLEIRHPLAEPERHQIVGWIKRAFGEVHHNSLEYCSDLKELREELTDVETRLERAPDDDVIAPLVQQAKELTEEVGEYGHAISQLEERAETIEVKVGRLKSQLEGQYKAARKVEDEAGALELADQVRDALSDYYDRLTAKKLEELNENLSACFQTLSNKPQYYSSVRLTEDLKPVIQTSDAGQRTGAQISAGESQIFATALLWALAKTSGRELPFVIDTPLGRLDTEHRARLVSNFLPNAASQVIVLSTDTELDQGLMEELQPWISRTYLLEYDESEGRTVPREGYFW